jgi:hypothetical protein
MVYDDTNFLSRSYCKYILVNNSCKGLSKSQLTEIFFNLKPS